MNETTITIMGNLISGVRFRRSPEGVAAASFRLSSTERRYDRDRGHWVNGDRLFVTVRCWRTLAEHTIAVLEKGDPVIVHGRLQTREYAVDGQRRHCTELTASAIGPDLTRCRAAPERHGARASEQQAGGETAAEPVLAVAT
ncbi:MULTISPECIES: single-stranded DNA-binding protein [Actinoalloteichus]|uniref:Single-stranded DNA-binding protein n=1 Tax=Actinoalloteichus fjordicus TaxID=1612552 RepID=A0AAC9PQW7_9PSEU|nr:MULTISPECIES: single-stranded DNA-binding protein [Actinoalloteichus]APU13639.1 single stranded DNA-binding protein [Actinoalloteichus fjordicus]APU19585.1 single stranded DNA-binding protein [Actinoalloteichus sp. GBA129-24]